MSFKDKKPETNCHFDNQVTYLAADMDEYLAIVEPKAEKWDKYTLDGKNITPEIIEQIEELENKLEAIKAVWLENAKQALRDKGDPEINDILCEIGMPLTKVTDYNLEEMVKIQEAS